MLPKIPILIVFLCIPCISDFSGKVIAISDGDTYTILTKENKSIKVRLHGIDCPEKNQPFGLKAKQYASSLTFGKQVDVHEISTDRYGRSVGIINTGDGVNINYKLVESGLAWWYSQYAPTDKKLEELQIYASSRKIGLWSEPSPVAPWEFRHKSKNQNSYSIDSDAPDGEVVLNTNSLKYHCADCQWVNRCTENCIRLDISDAIKKGGLPCKVCRGTCK